MRITEEEYEALLANNPSLARLNSKPLVRSKKRPDLNSTKPQARVTITEKDFQEWFRQLALTYGYLFYHTHRSQFSPSGFPDAVLIRLEPEPRLIFCELKTDNLKVSQPSFEQWKWLYMLQHIPGIEAYLFRPSDRTDIESILK